MTSERDISYSVIRSSKYIELLNRIGVRIPWEAPKKPLVEWKLICLKSVRTGVPTNIQTCIELERFILQKENGDTKNICKSSESAGG